MAQSPSFDAFTVSGGNDAADADVSLSHNLGRIPVEAFTVYVSRAAAVYRGSVAWTSTTISVRVGLARTSFILLVF
jgi:hypothetical protein